MHPDVIVRHLKQYLNTVIVRIVSDVRHIGFASISKATQSVQACLQTAPFRKQRRCHYQTR